MIWYREIVPVNQPTDIGLDPNGRGQVVFTVNTVKGISLQLEEELISVLEVASVGTFETNIFASSRAQIPAEGGPYLTVRAEGGATPLNIHNDQGPAYPRPAATITVVAPTYSAARAMAWAAWNALSVIRNRDITP